MHKHLILLFFILALVGCEPATWQQMVHAPFDTTTTLGPKNKKSCWKYWKGNSISKGHTTWCYFETSQAGAYDISTTIFSSKYGYIIPKNKEKISPRPVVIALKLKHPQATDDSIFKTISLPKTASWVEANEEHLRSLIVATHTFTPVHYWHQKYKNPKLKHWVNPAAQNGQVWLVEAVLNDAGQATSVLLYLSWHDKSDVPERAFDPVSYLSSTKTQDPWFPSAPFELMNRDHAILDVHQDVVWNRQPFDAVLPSGLMRTKKTDPLLVPKWFEHTKASLTKLKQEQQILQQSYVYSAPLVKFNRSASVGQFNQVMYTLNRLGYGHVRLGVASHASPEMQSLNVFQMKVKRRKQSENNFVISAAKPTSMKEEGTTPEPDVVAPVYSTLRLQVHSAGFKIGLAQENSTSWTLLHVPFDDACAGFHLCRDTSKQEQSRKKAASLDRKGHDSIPTYNALLVASNGAKLSAMIRSLVAKHQTIKTLEIEVFDTQLSYQTLLDIVALSHLQLKTKTSSCGQAFEAPMLRQAVLCPKASPLFNSVTYQVVAP